MKIIRISLKYLFLLFLLVACSTKDLPRKNKLNKNWKFSESSKNTFAPATVPGTIHTDLIANNLIPDPFYKTNEKNLQWIDKKNWTYQTTFFVNKELLNRKNISLIFEGLDTFADVFLNEKKILTSSNMFLKWEIDVSANLILGENKLLIKFYSPIKKGLFEIKKYGINLPADNDQSELGCAGNNKVSPFIRKAPYHFGWDWGPRLVTSGIWKPVYILSWNQNRINNIHFTTDSISTDFAYVTTYINLKSNFDSRLKAKIFIDKKEVLLSNITQIDSTKLSVQFKITHPKLWWPHGMGKQYLYNLKVKIFNDKILCDEEEIKIGIRKLELVREKDSIGESFRFKINNKNLFVKGANYIPQNIFLPEVDSSKYEKIIKAAVDANMNMLRVWGGGIYENDYFYDLCDKYGILIWQDFMFACSMYPATNEFLKNISNEAEEQIIRLRNHPSIALWCGNNEILDAWNRWGWQKRFNENEQKRILKAYEKIFNKLLPSIVKKFDDRPYHASSPSYGLKPSNLQGGDYHYWGVWHGGEDFDAFENNIGRFMSEYGFQSFPQINSLRKFSSKEDWSIDSEVLKAHQRSYIGNGRIKEYLLKYFHDVKDFKDFLYEGQLLQAIAMEKAILAHRKNKNICGGTLLWQLNDCWPAASWSIIDFYGDKKAAYFFVKRAFNTDAIKIENANKVFKVFFLTEKKFNSELNLSWEWKNFKDSTIAKGNERQLISNSGLIYFEINKQCLKNLSQNYLRLNILSSNKIIFSENKFLVKPKYLRLKNSEPEYRIIKSNNKIGEYLIQLKSNYLIKNLYVYFENITVDLNDNYFDLFPNVLKSIKFSSEKDLIQLQESIKFNSLNKINVKF